MVGGADEHGHDVPYAGTLPAFGEGVDCKEAEGLGGEEGAVGDCAEEEMVAGGFYVGL